MTGRGIALAMLLSAGPLGAQGVRISGTSVVEYVDVQPMVQDSVPIAATQDSGLLRRTANGIIVECISGDAYCQYVRSAPRVSTIPAYQALDVSAWGLVPGLSAYVSVRGSTAGGSASEIFPQANSFEVLSGYLEYDSDRFRVQAGRAWIQSGLGYYNYDGGSVLVRPIDQLSVNVYGGRSLVPGLNATVTSSAVTTIEPLAPNEGSYLLGAQLEIRPVPQASFDVQYQRELRTDAAGLYSDRFAADGDVRFARLDLSGGLQYDLATGTFNDAHIRAQAPLGLGFHVDAEVRRYSPYFDLWTIWGVFAPVGYTEERLGAAWGSTDQRFAFSLSGGARRYDQANAGVNFLPLVNSGWDVDATGSWRFIPKWTVHGEYRLLYGSGATLDDASGGLRWTPTAHTSIDLTGSASETLYEFQVGTGQVLGVGLAGSVEILAGLSAIADVGIYRYVGGETPQITNWNQTRASFRLEWTLGRDPGLR